MADFELDLQARKQLLLTRMALERMQLTHDSDELRHAASPRHMLARGIRSLLPDGLADTLLRPSSPARRAAAAGMAHRVMQAVVFARRYPLVVSIAGGMLARRSIRRIIFVGVILTVAAGVWVTTTRRSVV